MHENQCANRADDGDGKGVAEQQRKIDLGPSLDKVFQRRRERIDRVPGAQRPVTLKTPAVGLAGSTISLSSRKGLTKAKRWTPCSVGTSYSGYSWPSYLYVAALAGHSGAFCAESCESCLNAVPSI